MSMKAALTFAWLNMKKLEKLLDRLDENIGKFTPLFEKIIYFRINIEKSVDWPGVLVGLSTLWDNT